MHAALFITVFCIDSFSCQWTLLLFNNFYLVKRLGNGGEGRGLEFMMPEELMMTVLLMSSLMTGLCLAVICGRQFQPTITDGGHWMNEEWVKSIYYCIAEVPKLTVLLSSSTCTIHFTIQLLFTLWRPEKCVWCMP